MIRKLLLIPGILLAAACYNPDAYVDFDKNKVISFTDEQAAGIADGMSTVQVGVKISNDAIPSKRTVVFKTDFGKFKGGADSILVTAGADFKANAELVSADTGIAIVSAKIAGIKTDKTMIVTFNRAYPETMVVQADAFLVQTGFQHSINITATLGKHNGGIPSTGQMVSFTAYDSLGHLCGYFMNGAAARTDNKGMTKVSWSSGNTTPTGFITMSAHTPLSSDSSLAAVVTFYLAK